MSRRPPVLSLLALGALCLSCGGGRSETPIPGNRRAFIGSWRAPSGFTLTINAGGFASVVQTQRPDLPDSENLSIKVAPPVIGHIRVYFPNDRMLQLISPHLYAREYRVTRAPYREGGTWHVVLDGVTLDRTP